MTDYSSPDGLRAGSTPPLKSLPSSRAESNCARTWRELLQGPGAISGWEWFYLFVGLTLVFHYEWLMDDAFVYYRYIDNWLFLKIGLVYNQGEYTEGYSSILWLLILSGLRNLNLNWWAITKLLAALCFFAFWLSGVVLHRRVTARMAAQSEGLTPPIPKLNLPLALLCTNYGVLCYFTSGLETPLVQVYALLFCLFVLSSYRHATEEKWLHVVLSLAPVLRHELVIPFGMVLAWHWFQTRRFPWLCVLLSGTWLGALAIFRIYYYADLFPNTFYLKDLLDLEQGLYYIHETFSTYWLYFLTPLTLLVVGRMCMRADGRGLDARTLLLPERAVLVLCAVVIIGYVIKIGGDPRHYRYLAFPFCVLLGAAAGLGEYALRNSRAATSGAVAIGLMLLTFSSYPPQLSRHPFTFSEKHRTYHKVNDASAHRRKLDLNFVTWTRELPLDRLRKLGRKKPFAYREVKSYYRCIRAYRDIDKRFVHSLGLTEPILSRTIMKANRPAHKWGLLPLAQDIARIQRAFPVHKPGMYRAALQKGLGAAWIERNLESIEIIERKIYNRKNFRENLSLAFTFPAPIQP